MPQANLHHESDHVASGLGPIAAWACCVDDERSTRSALRAPSATDLMTVKTKKAPGGPLERAPGGPPLPERRMSRRRDIVVVTPGYEVSPAYCTNWREQQRVTTYVKCPPVHLKDSGELSPRSLTDGDGTGNRAVTYHDTARCPRNHQSMGHDCVSALKDPR